MIILKTNHGDISIELDEQHAPMTAANFLKHAQAGFYDNTIFHRVIDGFMIQGGGFTSGMQAKPRTENIENEAPLAQANLRGSVAMARTSEPHSASTQFFINLIDNNFLNHTAKTPQGWGYCVFGHVVDGMQVVDKIAKEKTAMNAGHQDVPVDDVVINEVIVTE